MCYGKKNILFASDFTVFYFYIFSFFFSPWFHFLCVMMRYDTFSLEGSSLDKLFGFPDIYKLIHTEKSGSSVSWSCFLMCFAWATRYTKT